MLVSVYPVMYGLLILAEIKGSVQIPYIYENVIFEV